MDKPTKLHDPLVWIDLEMTGMLWNYPTTPCCTTATKQQTKDTFAQLQCTIPAQHRHLQGDMRPHQRAWGVSSTMSEVGNGYALLRHCSGLDLSKDTIIEIAVIVTDGQLKHSIEVRRADSCRRTQRIARTDLVTGRAMSAT